MSATTKCTSAARTENAQRKDSANEAVKVMEFSAQKRSRDFYCVCVAGRLTCV